VPWQTLLKSLPELLHFCRKMKRVEKKFVPDNQLFPLFFFLPDPAAAAGFEPSTLG
jgi:hypothetical protein